MYLSTPGRGLLAGLLLLSACQSDPKHPAGLPQGQLAALQGTWLLVPEASRADTLTYRRNTYRFRYRPGGRPGFRLGPGGRFIRYELAPGGGLLAQEGTWSTTSQNSLRIHLSDAAPTLPDYTLKLLSYRQEVLRLLRRDL